MPFKDIRNLRKWNRVRNRKDYAIRKLVKDAEEMLNDLPSVFRIYAESLMIGIRNGELSDYNALCDLAGAPERKRKRLYSKNPTKLKQQRKQRARRKPSVTQVIDKEKTTQCDESHRLEEPVTRGTHSPKHPRGKEVRACEGTQVQTNTLPEGVVENGIQTVLDATGKRVSYLEAKKLNFEDALGSSRNDANIGATFQNCVSSEIVSDQRVLRSEDAKFLELVRRTVSRLPPQEDLGVPKKEWGLWGEWGPHLFLEAHQRLVHPAYHGQKLKSLPVRTWKNWDELDVVVIPNIDPKTLRYERFITPKQRRARQKMQEWEKSWDFQGVGCRVTDEELGVVVESEGYHRWCHNRDACEARLSEIRSHPNSRKLYAPSAGLRVKSVGSRRGRKDGKTDSSKAEATSNALPAEPNSQT